MFIPSANVRSNSGIPKVTTNRALLNRPTMDNTALKLKSSTVKKVPLTARPGATATVTKPLTANNSTRPAVTAKVGGQVARKLPFDGKTPSSNGTKTQVGARSQATVSGARSQPAGGAANRNAKSATVSVINKKGGLKDKLDIGEKKKKEYMSKIKEMHSKIVEANAELEILKSSMLNKSYKELEEKLLEERKRNQEIKDLIKEKMSTLNHIKSNIKSLEEKTNRENEMIKELKAKTENMRMMIMDKKIKEERLLEKCQRNSETLEKLDKEEKEMEEIVQKIYEDNKSLHNDIYNLKGNVQIFFKARPLLSTEHKESSYPITYNDEYSITVNTRSLANSKSTKREFVFDKIFLPKQPTNQLFEDASCFVSSAFEGHTSCIILYGPEASGKTYTLEGPEDNQQDGLLFLMTDHICDEMKKLELIGIQYKITVKCFEVNEDVAAEIYSQEFDSGELIFDTYFDAKKCRQFDSSSFVFQIRLEGKHSNLSIKIVGVINVMEVTSDEKSVNNLLKAPLEGLLQNKNVDATSCKESWLKEFLRTSTNDPSKILVILHVAPTLNTMSNGLSAMKFGNDIVACRMKQTKKKI